MEEVGVKEWEMERWEVEGGGRSGRWGGGR